MGLSFTLGKIDELFESDCDLDFESRAWLRFRQRRWNFVARKVHEQTGNYPVPVVERPTGIWIPMTCTTFHHFRMTFAEAIVRHYPRKAEDPAGKPDKGKADGEDVWDYSLKLFPHLYSISDVWSFCLPWTFPKPFEYNSSNIQIVSAPMLLRELESFRKAFRIQNRRRGGLIDDGCALEVFADLLTCARLAVKRTCCVHIG
jgi:hypothetical protein